MSNLLEISGVHKHYGSTKALVNISLKIEQAAAIGLVGKNGAGKTTLLSILSGALRPSSGEVLILGETPQTIATTGKLNILPQDATFKKGIPVKKQLVLFARLQGMSQVHAESELDALLSELGECDFVNKAPEQLSYGQRKRVGIVQAFLGKPQLVILDEPTAGLDPVVANDVRKLIRKLSRDSAFIISSHNLYEIEDICSSVIILDKGKLLANKAISELASKDSSISISLNRTPEEALLSALKDIDTVNEIQLDSVNNEKFILQLSSQEMDELQLRIQRTIMEQGYTITEFSRGKALIDGMMDLVEND
jgi:ABC-2 type transport system ATP-binding protein